MKVLVVGDTHVDEEQDLTRFHLLGQMIVDHKPDEVILIGDFLTLNCLSAWDRNKRLKMEGKRYQKELIAGNLALDLMLGPLKVYNGIRKSRKEKQYKPKLVYIEGNHEDRLNRYFEDDPTFLGSNSIRGDLNLDDRGFLWIPYRTYYYVEEVGFTHIPFNKVAPISGVDITRKAQMITVKSVVFGHVHEQHLSHIHKEGMPHLQDTYCCGCFISKKEDYVHGRVTNYWRGITLLHIYKPGRFDIEPYSLGRMERLYT